MSHLRVDNFDKYTLYVVLLGEPCRKHNRCLYVIWQFWKDSNQNVWKHYMSTIASSLKIMMKKNDIFLPLDIVSMKSYNYVYCLLSTPPFHFIVCERQEMSGIRKWAWVMVSCADEYQWTCVHRVWAPTNVTKRDWASCNHEKACGFHTNAAQELPLDQSWSYCCRSWAQLSVAWGTTAAISSKWKQNRQILWRSPAVLKLAVSRWFSNKKPPMCNCGLN